VLQRLIGRAQQNMEWSRKKKVGLILSPRSYWVTLAWLLKHCLSSSRGREADVFCSWSCISIAHACMQGSCWVWVPHCPPDAHWLWQPDTTVCGTGDWCISHGLVWLPWVVVRSEAALPPLFQNIFPSVEVNKSAWLACRQSLLLELQGSW